MKARPSASIALGVLGTGYISDQFAAALVSSPVVRVMAVASRDAARARQFAQRWGIPNPYAGYDALLADPAIEAVYIGLPNSLHAEWAIRATQAGKHVLCEKPLATSAAQARRMREAARRAAVVLLEAFPFHFQPQTLEVARRISAGDLGRIRYAQASIGFTVTSPHSIRLQRELAGGALLDAGCYPVSLARLVFGVRPARADAVAAQGRTGIDETTVATLAYPGGGLAQVACSIATSPHRTAVITGSEGVIDTSYANHTEAGSTAFYRLRHGTGWDAGFERIETGAGNGFRLEAEAFARMVRSVDCSEADAFLAMSIDNAAALDAIATSVQTGRQEAVSAEP